MSTNIPSIGAVRKIAVLRALFVGDLLCSTPALRDLRGRFPAAEITLIGLPWATDFVSRTPALDRIRVFPGYPGITEGPRDPGSTAAFLAEARAYGYDLAIQMHGDGRSSNGFIAALGAPFTLGFRCGEAPDSRLALSLPYAIDEHETLRWLRLIATLGDPLDGETHLSLTRTAHDAAAAAALLTGALGAGPLIGLHLGAKEEARRWPTARFIALAEHLVARLDARIVLTGGESERTLVAEARQMARVPVLDLAGQTDFGTFAAAIAGLDLLVTNDTGASHVAAAVGTRSVILFGPSRPGHWAPLDGLRHRALDAVTLADTALGGAEALRQLPLEPVLQACLKQLADGRQKAGMTALMAGTHTQKVENR